MNAQEYSRAIGVRGAFGHDHYQYAGAEFSFQKDVGWYASTQWDVYTFTGIRQWKIINNFGTQLEHDIGLAIRSAIR